MEPAHIATPPSKAKVFVRRLMTSLVLWTVVLAALFSGNKFVSDYVFLLAIYTTLFGLMYVPWLLNFIQKINFFPGVQGHYFLLYFVLITKFSDTGAYSVGSLFGRHKMIPRISPGKTWEGFAGAILISMLASVLFVHFLGHKMPGMDWRHAIALGVILGTAAVVGDLIESLFKREAGVKDSGSLFPGIG